MRKLAHHPCEIAHCWCLLAGQVEAQLADVQPLIDAARTAVGGIKADNINEVGSAGVVRMLLPPASILGPYTCTSTFPACCCILLLNLLNRAHTAVSA
jgi:hypothetical protein